MSRQQVPAAAETAAAASVSTATESSQQSQPKLQQPEDEQQEEVEMHNNGWNEDDYEMDGEEFDDVIIDKDVNDADAATNRQLDNTVALSAAAMNETTIDSTTNNNSDNDNGWDDSLLDDVDFNSPPRSTSAVKHEEEANQTIDEPSYHDGTTCNDDIQEVAQPSVSDSEGVLGRAAESFGAALLASLDDEEDANNGQQTTAAGGGGFGSGFVMKGLSRFIEAATAPQSDTAYHDEDNHQDYEEDINDGEGGGWDHDDDDNLEMEDDFDFNHQDVNDNQDDGENNIVRDNNIVTDDDHIHQGELHQSEAVAAIQNVSEATQHDIISQEDAWEDDINMNDSTFDSEVLVEKNDNVEEKDVVSIDEDIQDNKRIDSYEIDKNNSPEPVPKQDRSTSLPHQDSWYVSAMEGGQGGVVYSEKISAANKEVTLDRVQEGPALVDVVATNEVVFPVDTESNLGMPISELPSVNTSPRSSSDENIVSVPASNAPITQCELKCECLELIMPIPDEDGGTSGSSAEKDGFGTKTLPDGRTVLVNYEQLLRNEATKRILLDRTVESYQRTIANLQSNHQMSLQAKSMEYEEKENLLHSQLDVANNEIAELKSLVTRLQHNREQPESETHLFEAELAAASDEKERLQNQVVFLQEEIKSKDVSCEKYLQVQKELEQNLDEVKAEAQSLQSSLTELQNESMKLKSENEDLQRECDELQEDLNGRKEEVFQLNRQSSENFADKASTAVEVTHLREQTVNLKTKVESLQKELTARTEDNEQLNHKVSEAFANHAAKAVEYERTCSRLEDELSEKNTEVAALREENDSLRIAQRDSNAKIDELRATIESMDDCDTGEVNHLSAEVANLKYELEAKNAECIESTAELSRLGEELSGTKAELTTLREENDSLRIVQRDSSAEITELRATIESMDGDAGEVNHLAAEVANLKYELEAKAAEHEEATVENRRLKEELTEKKTVETTLREENESLRITQRDSSAEIIELRAAIELMDGDAGEVNRLSAEVANLKYELDAKNAELNDNMNALQALQAKLDNAEECLKESMNASDGDTEDALKKENYELSRKVVDLQSNLNAIESSRLDLQLALEEKTHSSESLQTQINSLNAQLLETSELQQEIVGLKNSVEEQSRERDMASVKAEELQGELHSSQMNHDMTVKESEDKISKLQAQITDLLKDHNVSMQSMEGRLLDASNQVTSLNAQCEDYRLKLEHSFAECAGLKEVMSKAEREKSELSSALQLANSALEENEANASRNDSSVGLMKEEMESIMHQNKELIERNQVLLQEKADAGRALEAKISEMEKEKAILESQNKELVERVQVLLRQKADADQFLDAKTKELEQEKNLFEASHRANSEAQQSMLDLEKQLHDLKTTNKRLESELFEASFLSDDNDALQKERDELVQKVKVLQDQVNELASQTVSASHSEACSSVERDALLARISNLEAELRADNAADLRDELTSIQEEREQLDLDNEELLVQLGLMQQDKLENEAARQVEIDELHEQISDLKQKCDRLQQDRLGNDSSVLVQNDNDDIERLQEEIRSEKAKFTALNKDISLLKLKLADKESEVLSIREEIQNVSKEKDEEIEKLRAEKDKVVSAKELMQSALDQKDGEICRLRAEQSTTREEKYEIEAEGPLSQDNASIEAEEEKEYCVGDEDDDDVCSLQGLLAEDADSDDFLRSQIVILAQALERAELHRAEALERIITERRSNANVVSQLGDSVKRFYSTIRRSEGP